MHSKEQELPNLTLFLVDQQTSEDQLSNLWAHTSECIPDLQLLTSTLMRGTVQVSETLAVSPSMMWLTGRGQFSQFVHCESLKFHLSQANFKHVQNYWTYTSIHHMCGEHEVNISANLYTVHRRIQKLGHSVLRIYHLLQAMTEIVETVSTTIPKVCS